MNMFMSTIYKTLPRKYCSLEFTAVACRLSFFFTFQVVYALYFFGEMRLSIVWLWFISILFNPKVEFWLLCSRFTAFSMIKILSRNSHLWYCQFVHSRLFLLTLWPKEGTTSYLFGYFWFSPTLYYLSLVAWTILWWWHG